MHMRPKRFSTVCTLVCSLLFSGWNAAQAQVDATAILTNLVDTVILPTYTNLDTRADDLVSAIGAPGFRGQRPGVAHSTLMGHWSHRESEWAHLLTARWTARNLLEAIMWHGGEAESSREHVRQLSQSDREALAAFLQSL